VDSIQERLAKFYDQLRPSERVLADFIINNPEDIALFTSAELAKVCNISKSTVTRFFQRLGFNSFREGKILARQLRKQGVPIIDENEQNNAHAFETYLDGELVTMQQLFQKIDLKTIETVVDTMQSARNILVIGFRNSYPLALHLRQQLTQLRSNVSIAPNPGQSLGEELAGLDKSDLVILFGFRRRPKVFRKLIETLNTLHIPTLVVADASANGYRQKADLWIEVPLDSQLAFDSYIAPMSLISLLVNRFSHRTPVDSQSRISEIDYNYSTLNELSIDSTHEI